MSTPATAAPAAAQAASVRTPTPTPTPTPASTSAPKSAPASTPVTRLPRARTTLPSALLGRLTLGAAGLATVALALGRPLSEVTAGSVAIGAALLSWAALDALLSLRAWRRAPLQWQRQLPPALAIGVQRHLHAELHNPGRHAWRLHVFDHTDASLVVDGLPQAAHLPAGQRLQLGYNVLPRERGVLHFAPAELRLKSRLGALELVRRVGTAQTLHVYPNFAAVARYAWLSTDRRLASIGIKSFAQRGSGTDFKQLSDYHVGDPVRHIDWKATLKHQRPIVREFQDERDQSVFFLLDCGRRMRADEGESARRGSHFDDALNALMLLAYVALKDGDEVGAMTFGTPPGEQRLFAPRKGSATLNALMARLYDVQPQASHSDYLMAARDLIAKHPKRALVVVLTNFRDEDSSELAPALRLLGTRHLVMLASLRERVLRELTEQPLAHEGLAVDVAGAHLFAQSRDDAFRRLATRNGLLLDVEPQHLAAELVNRYRAVKRSGLL